jgi:hypothetical protein
MLLSAQRRLIATYAAVIYHVYLPCIMEAMILLLCPAVILQLPSRSAGAIVHRRVQLVGRHAATNLFGTCPCQEKQVRPLSATDLSALSCFVLEEAGDY